MSPATPIEVETETLRTCPHCGSRSLARWRESYDRQHQLSQQCFVYSRCSACVLYFLSVRPVEAEIRKFYPGDYVPYRSSNGAGSVRDSSFQRPAYVRFLRGGLRRFNACTDQLVMDQVPRKIESFYRLQQAGATILDFGCGSPGFLDRARDAGWRTIGIDFSSDVVESVRAGGHEALLDSPEAWHEIKDGSLELVRMHHVLEHLYRPREILAHLKQKMKPQAVLHLGLPNPEGLSSRIFRSRWFSLDCPRHIMLYTEDGIMAMLREMGFQELTLIREATVNDLVRSWGYVLQDRGRIGQIELLRLPGGALAEALRQPVRALTRLGLADRFHVFARTPEEA